MVRASLCPTLARAAGFGRARGDGSHVVTGFGEYAGEVVDVVLIKSVEE